MNTQCHVTNVLQGLQGDSLLDSVSVLLDFKQWFLNMLIVLIVHDISYECLDLLLNFILPVLCASRIESLR